MNPLGLTSITQIKILGDIDKSLLIPANEFLALQKSGVYKENKVPLGANATEVYYATINGEEVIYQRGTNEIYVIADVDNFGFAILHYILNNVTLAVEPVDSLPLIKLFNFHKEVLQMNDSTQLKKLQQMALQKRSAVAEQPGTEAGLAPMTFSGAPQENVTLSGGITPKGTANEKSVAMFAKLYGHVDGYICGTGPQISMSLRKTKAKDKTGGKDTYNFNIIPVQSKPSKIVRILLALPKGCCMKDGQPATPAEINEGNFDFDKDQTDLVYLAVRNETAIAYIGSLGKALPEYGPTHGEKKHYSAEDILGNKENVGFVEMVYRQNKRKDRKQGEDVIMSLKPTKRRSLFRQGNHVPLKLVKHISTECKTAEDAMKINQIAFGYWDKKANGSNESRLNIALNNTSSLLFKRQYEIVNADGKKEKVDGIGSAFFMEGTSVKLADGAAIPKMNPSYVPWYVVAKRGEGDPVTEPLTQIAYKEEVISKNGKPRYVNKYLTLAENSGDKEYEEYRPFLNTVKKYLSDDELHTLGKERKRNVPGSKSFSPEADAAFLNLLHTNSNLAEDVNKIFEQHAMEQLM